MVSRCRVRTEGRQETEKGQNARGVEKGEGDAHNKDATLSHRPVDERFIERASVCVVIWRPRTNYVDFGILSVHLHLDAPKVGQCTSPGALHGCTLVHGGHYCEVDKRAIDHC